MQHLAVAEQHVDRRRQHDDARHREPAVVGAGEPQRGHQRDHEHGHAQQQRLAPADQVHRRPQEGRGQRHRQAGPLAVGRHRLLAAHGVAHHHAREVRHEDVDGDQHHERVARALEQRPGERAGRQAAARRTSVQSALPLVAATLSPAEACATSGGWGVCEGGRRGCERSPAPSRVVKHSSDPPPRPPLTVILGLVPRTQGRASTSTQREGGTLGPRQKAEGDDYWGGGVGEARKPAPQTFIRLNTGSGRWRITAMIAAQTGRT